MAALTAESASDFGSGALGLTSGLAGRYAKALFDLATEQNQRDQVAADLGRLKTMLAESADLTRLVMSPAFSRDEQGRAIKAVLERAQFGELTRRFIAVTARNRRLFALLRIIDAFTGLVANAKGEVAATVTSAQPLTDAQVQQIRSALSAKAGRSVAITTAVDPSLIGGLVVRMGSRMVDSSIRTKLQMLESAMKGVG
jgi:F-type H+-transporting ATPase subunit delta